MQRHPGGFAGRDRGAPPPRAGGAVLPQRGVREWWCRVPGDDGGAGCALELAGERECGLEREGGGEGGCFSFSRPPPLSLYPPPTQVAAILNLLRTVFIILAMGVGIYLLQRDATRLVARPLERMLSKARALADNPLSSRRAKFDRGGRDRDRLMETRILEVAFTKVCSLLAVGFGDAGAEVIAGNLRSGGDLSAVVPGRRVRAIFGFCDIRQFTDATEVLQEDVMEFVNTIAKIVHQEVSVGEGGRVVGGGEHERKHTHSPFPLPPPHNRSTFTAAPPTKILGTPSSSSGSFPTAPWMMLPWRPPWRPSAPRRPTAPLPPPPPWTTPPPRAPSWTPSWPSRKRAAWLTKRWRPWLLCRPRCGGRPASQSLWGAPTSRPGCPGLESGWGLACMWGGLLKEPSGRSTRWLFVGGGWERVEGVCVREGPFFFFFSLTAPIPPHQIDASYLSPNVNMASRLEAATKQYGVPLLMSGEFAALLSPALRARARPIDVVTVKGSAVPVVLHTYDVDVRAAPGLEAGGGEGGGGAPPPATFSDRPYSAEFDEHPDLAPTWAVDHSFITAWRDAFSAYRMGEWGAARARLEACAASQPGGRDGPVAALLAFMAGHGYVAPLGWRGFRELTEK